MNQGFDFPRLIKYSNAGIGLLSYLVATTTGKTWEDQVNSEILQLLGMNDTTLRPTPEQQRRLAQAHNRTGQDAPRWPVFAWYAAGGLRSTAHDMISFGEAYLGHSEVSGKPVSAELIAAMQLAQKPIFTMPNGNMQAMAWVNNMRGDDPVILKNGGTAGFGSGIAICPNKDATIFIAMNQVGAQPISKGLRSCGVSRSRAWFNASKIEILHLMDDVFTGAGIATHIVGITSSSDPKTCAPYFDP
jgi:CubicO group peptidase (beta-lactamase class C family)